MRLALLVLLAMTFLCLAPQITPLNRSASAQEFGVEEDLEYARGLMKRRMHDLAFQVLEAIINNSEASDGEKASANLEKANIFKDKFRRGLTLKERIEASEQADRAYQDFVTNFGDHPLIIPAKFDYAEFLRDLGKYRIRLSEETLLVGGTAEEAANHREVALEKLKKAADLFDELKVVIPGSGKEEEYRNLYELCKFYRAIMYYDLGRAEKDEANRMATFQDGINNLEDYIFENEDNLRGFRGYLYKGLCHREFNEENQRADAITCFQGIIYAYESAIADPDRGWRNWEEALQDPAAKHLLEEAFWRFAETYVKFGQYPNAEKLMAKFRKIMTEGKASYGLFGYLALLEEAKAYFLNGNVNKAIEIVSDVASRAGANDKFIQFHCDRNLARFLDEVEDKTQLDPDVVFKAAKGAYSQDRFYDALRHFHTVLAIKKGVGPEALECWDFIGRCYRQLGFLREAALASAKGAFDLKAIDEARAQDLARSARSAYQKIFKQTKAAADRDRLNKHKELMQQVFGSKTGAYYDPAVQAMQEGRYEKAIEEFAKVTPDSEKYDLAQSYITFCMVQQTMAEHEKAAGKRKMKRAERSALDAAKKAGLEKAIGKVDEYVRYTKSNPIRGEPVKKANREQAIGVALQAKAVALKELGKWNEGLDVLVYFDSGRITNQDQLRNASILKVQMLLGKNDLAGAEKELVNLESKFGSSAQKNLVSLKGLLGVALQDRAARLEKEGKKQTAVNTLLKSVAYRHAWVRGITPKIENLFSLAKDLYDLNHFDEAKSYLDAIMDKWGSVEKPRGKLKKTLHLARLYLARCLVWQGKYLEAEPILRSLYESNKKNLSMLKEYAELLTGTVRGENGDFIYIPGRGAHAKDATEGYRLWSRVVKKNERESTTAAFQEYLGARFHQNLVRWAQGKPELASKSINQLRVSLGPNLDRRPGARNKGYWEERFEWLEKQIRRKAPQTPPPMPAPKGGKPSK